MKLPKMIGIGALVLAVLGCQTSFSVFPPTETPTPKPTLLPTATATATATATPTETPTPVPPTATLTPTQQESSYQLPAVDVTVSILPDDWVKYDVVSENGHFEIALPEAWLHIPTDPEDFADLMDNADDSETAEFFQEQIQRMIQQGIQFIAYDISDPDLDDFATNMNVVTQPSPSEVTLDQFAAANIAQTRDALDLGANEVIERRVTLTGGEAAEIEAKTSFPDETGQEQEIAFLQYLLVVDDSLVVITFTTRADALQGYRAEFLEIADTFQLLD